MSIDYMSEQLPTALPNDPMAWAQAWLTEATERAVQPNPNAMTLATATAAGEVSARIVLCKSFVADPGYLVFYSNYESRKGREIAENSRVSALFHWDQLGRQIRLEGTAVRSPAAESDEYFASRHRGSQLGAWGSDQSRPIESRDALKQQLAEREAQPCSPTATTRTCHDRRIGVVFAYGRTTSSFGSTRRTEFTTGRAGRAK